MNHDFKENGKVAHLAGFSAFYLASY